MTNERKSHPGSPFTRAAIAALAGCITTVIFLGIVTLFQSHGRPLGHLVVAQYGGHSVLLHAV